MAVDPFISLEQGTFAIAYMRNQPCSKEGYRIIVNRNIKPKPSPFIIGFLKP
jgi:hypothetical protein